MARSAAVAPIRADGVQYVRIRPCKDQLLRAVAERRSAVEQRSDPDAALRRSERHYGERRFAASSCKQHRLQFGAARAMGRARVPRAIRKKNRSRGFGHYKVTNKSQQAWSTRPSRAHCFANCKCSSGRRPCIVPAHLNSAELGKLLDVARAVRLAPAPSRCSLQVLRATHCCDVSWPTQGSRAPLCEAWARSYA